MNGIDLFRSGFLLAAFSLAALRHETPGMSGCDRLDSMSGLGRLLIGLGCFLLLAGLLLLAANRIGLPLGRLPGDISYRGKNVSVYFPLGTSILLSILLSLMFYVFARFRR